MQPACNYMLLVLLKNTIILLEAIPQSHIAHWFLRTTRGNVVAEVHLVHEYVVGTSPLPNINMGLVEKPFLVLPTLPRLTSYTLGTMYKVRYFYCCAALQD